MLILGAEKEHNLQCRNIQRNIPLVYVITIDFETKEMKEHRRKLGPAYARCKCFFIATDYILCCVISASICFSCFVSFVLGSDHFRGSQFPKLSSTFNFFILSCQAQGSDITLCLLGTYILSVPWEIHTAVGRSTPADMVMTCAH